jgi:hypothetical protein
MALQELSLHGSEPLFIGGWFLPNLSICDELIDFWKINSEFHRPGIAGGAGIDGTGVNTDIKDSIDLTLTTQNPPPILEAYAVQLQEVMNTYKEKFYWAGAYSSYALMEPVNIQFYKPGAGFKQWHTERTESHFPSVTRHLVFMTYLNDVHDQGETEFFYQKIKVKPVKGLTLIWPADWTHTHRGVPSPTEDKFIITGWYNYIARPAPDAKYYRKIQKDGNI